MKEKFATFLADPNRVGLREIFENQSGEHNELDFKLEWPVKGNLAKHILAFANYGGGFLIIGVKEENGVIEPEGLKSFKPKENVFNELENSLPKSLLNALDIFDFNYEETEYNKLKGKKFQVLFIPNLPKLIPYVSIKDSESLKKNRIYIRRGVTTAEASYEEIQQIISKRIDTGYSITAEMELESHLDQLKTLYSQLKQYNIYYKNTPLADMSIAITRNMASVFGEAVKETNPNYPIESYEEFISRIIKQKKKRIEIELDVLGIND
ncbi:helix-turn-helix domain-containing protein [Rossellomorea sp. KS-H15a]|uniref:AlbA family DNA-binding domain-containing protein n=1 Tax=Rossellomorea sp. KS-H15a TaxID=2963940 RepID=UPI0020C61A21|nr:ATP-binding protein [Rossellomorea sp. KS-H15a]UTE76761.1 ATP-binding protein [Rossellomorea sp. KS-H15a]